MCVMVVCCVLSRCVSSNVADCIIQYMCIGNESVRSGRVYRLERVYVCIRVSFKVLCLYRGLWWPSMRGGAVVDDQGEGGSMRSIPVRVVRAGASSRPV